MIAPSRQPRLPAIRQGLISRRAKAMNAAGLVMVVILVIVAIAVVVAAYRDENARAQADNHRQRDQHPYTCLVLQFHSPFGAVSS